MTTDVDLRLRHLDTLQSVINRLAQNSFTVRGWSITLVSLVFAIVGTQGKASAGLVLLTLVPAWTFWGLDAFYLRQERLFRRLYSATARRLRDGDAAPDVVPFDMDVEPYKAGGSGWWRALVAPSTAVIPIMLSVVAVSYWLIRA